MHSITDDNNYLLDLICKAKKGDVYSFKLLVDRTSSYAYNLAYKTLFDEDNAKDVVQESFIRVWKHLNNYKHDCKFTTWLYKIVMNLCYDKIKMEKRRGSIFNRAADETEYPDSASPNIDDAVCGEDTLGQVKIISEGLPLKQRSVFILRDLQNLDLEEVSQIMNISIGAVKTNLFYARKFISQKFNELENRKTTK